MAGRKPGVTMRMSPQGMSAPGSFGCPSTLNDEVDQLLVKRHDRCGAGSGDAGHRCDGRGGAIEEGDAHRVVGILGCGQADVEGEQVIGAEAGIDADEPREAAGEQPGAHQQHQGERHGGDHQPAPQGEAAAIAGGTAPAFLEASCSECGRREARARGRR